MVGERGFEPPTLLVPNSRIEKIPSDTDQVGVIPKLNVHAGLASLQVSQFGIERHEVALSDPGRDSRVTTQTTTQTALCALRSLLGMYPLSPARFLPVALQRLPNHPLQTSTDDE